MLSVAGASIIGSAGGGSAPPAPVTAGAPVEASTLTPGDRPARPRVPAPPKKAKKAPARASRAAARLPLEPRAIARILLAQRGWGGQFGCLDALWTRESNWRTTAANPSSSAYGIPQSLPGEKMAAFGADWRTNPVTQIRWGLSYIAGRYGSPCGAWSFSQANGFY